jgi:hypothetical protein
MHREGATSLPHAAGHHDRAVRRRLAKDKRGQRALAMLVKSDIARWTPIMKAANLKAE